MKKEFENIEQTSPKFNAGDETQRAIRGFLTDAGICFVYDEVNARAKYILNVYRESKPFLSAKELLELEPYLQSISNTMPPLTHNFRMLQYHQASMNKRVTELEHQLRSTKFLRALLVPKKDDVGSSILS